MTQAEHTRYLELLTLEATNFRLFTDYDRDELTALQERHQRLIDNAFFTLEVLRQATFALESVVMLTGNKTLVPYLEMCKAHLELFKD